VRTVVIKEAKILLNVAIVANICFLHHALQLYYLHVVLHCFFFYLAYRDLFLPCPNFPAFSPDRSRIDTNNEDLERTYVVVSPLAGSDFNLQIDVDRRLTPVRVEPSSC
jgi:hypothetical protein